MNLRRWSKYFYKHPKALFNYSFIISLGLHAVLFVQIPFLKFSSMPAQKDKITIINISLKDVDIRSKTNVISRKKEEKELPKEIEIVKEEDAIPYLEEKKIEKDKKETEKKEFIPPPPSISKDILIKAKETYKDRILKRINSVKHYPILARKRGQEGVVKVKFILNRDGMLKDEAIIINRCKHKILNNTAVSTIVMANPYPAFPKEIKRDEMSFIVDVDFRLDEI